MYNQIVVPLDGGSRSANAVFVADRIARRVGASVMLASFVNSERQTEERRRALKNLAAPYGDHMSCVVTKQKGGIDEEIVAMFDRAPNQLVVMATWGRSRSIGILESQAESVLAVTGAPILMVGPGVALDAGWPGDDSRPVVVATNGLSTAEAAGPAAVDWAQELGQPISVVTVVERDFFHRAEPSADPHRVAGFAAELDQMGASTATPVTLEGPKPGLSVCRQARDQNASLIVVSSRGRRGDRRTLFGSEAMSIVHNSPVPVLVISSADHGD